MLGKSIMVSYLMLTCIVCLTMGETKKKNEHRLIGGHMKLGNDDDAELLMTNASGGKDKKRTKAVDEEKKTLSQQVADGKYGLIQQELFAEPSKRPGILSYEHNPEVPDDTAENLGGLSKGDIWLAENHLLVLKGGTYPPPSKTEGTSPQWPPIDDYRAPLRQVKIPAHPKVPPPFPIQLTDDGPLQIIGTNYTRTLNGTFDPTVYALPPPEFYGPPPIGQEPTPPSYNPFRPNTANITAGQGPYGIPPPASGDYIPGLPIPHFLLNGTLPPSFASLPPGAAIVPPPLPNNPEQYDEDDPSIYYPPPYSFYYPKDNSSKVPAGPLVPGIILPPPPNFFGPLEEQPKSTTTTTTTTPPPQIHPTTIPVRPTIDLNKKTVKKPLRVRPTEINNGLKPITTLPPPRVVTVLPVRHPNVATTTETPSPTYKKRPAVTILKPVPPIDNEVQGNPFKIYRPSVISSTRLPSKVYYGTEIDTNSITQSPSKYRAEPHTRQRASTEKQRYYYYEEPERPTSKRPYYVPDEYYFPAKQREESDYYYVTGRPQVRPQYRYNIPSKTDSFSLHVARLQNQINRFYTTTRPIYRKVPKPVYQFSFQANNYRQPSPPNQYVAPRPQFDNPDDPQDKFRPLPKYSVQIEPAIEIVPTTQSPPVQYYTERPGKATQNYYSTIRPDYQNVQFSSSTSTVRPISQYAFDATPNPIYQGYYTKPDETYLDENTKNYFTTFGMRLQGGGGVSTTTALPPQVVPTTQKPVSLEGDTLVNYVHPRPTANPDAEFVPVHGRYHQKTKTTAEIVKAIPVEIANEDGRQYISYRLPGDEGAHFYFLTPQLAQSRDQGARFYFGRNDRRQRRRSRNEKK